MSSESTPTPEVPDYTPEHDRADVADDLADVMDEAMRKFTVGRVRDAGNERVRISWLRAFVAAVGEYRKLVGDLEDEEIEDRIERLEALFEADETGGETADVSADADETAAAGTDDGTGSDG